MILRIFKISSIRQKLFNDRYKKKKVFLNIRPSNRSFYNLIKYSYNVKKNLKVRKLRNRFSFINNSDLEFLKILENTSKKNIWTIRDFSNLGHSIQYRFKDRKLEKLISSNFDWIGISRVSDSLSCSSNFFFRKSKGYLYSFYKKIKYMENVVTSHKVLETQPNKYVYDNLEFKINSFETVYSQTKNSKSFR